ncbi:MAG: hypothetical protein FWD53_06525 [Phycisphaerales bacterium]|nr:hypothetical protein [Phycisphaerales bacterium]
MTLAQTIIQKVLELPADKQLKVLDVVSQLEGRKSQREYRDAEGLLADVPSGLTFDDFQKNRQEMWGSSSDHELE